MNNRILTQEIYKEDCVGDSSAKHNYNLMALDTSLCNLSSKYFNIPNNFLEVFTDFSRNIASFTNASNLFSDPTPYNMVFSTVNLLSAFWERHEFSVHYPLNISTIDNSKLNCLSINIPDITLISLAKTYLNRNYPAQQFTNNTSANVIFFLYNVPVNPNDPNDLISIKSSPELSYNTRHMTISMNKQDIHFSNGKIFKFNNGGSGKWALYSSDIGDTQTLNQPILTQSPSDRVLIAPPTGRSAVNIEISNKTNNINVFDLAVQSGKYYSGFSDITLTIDSGVYVGSLYQNSPAILVDGLTTGDTVNIINNGFVYGSGGIGGVGEGLGNALTNKNNGGNGGDAILLNFPATITNNGVIAGGGGGGAGGSASDSNSSWHTGTTGNADPASLRLAGSGGGGGGGSGNISGNAGITETYVIPDAVSGVTYHYTIKKAADGSNGGLTTGGAGGLGYYNGGKGGDLGQNGTSTGIVDSKNNQLPPLGGLTGNYLKGKTFVIWNAQGTTKGTTKGNLS